MCQYLTPEQSQILKRISDSQRHNRESYALGSGSSSGSGWANSIVLIFVPLPPHPVGTWAVTALVPLVKVEKHIYTHPQYFVWISFSLRGDNACYTEEKATANLAARALFTTPGLQGAQPIICSLEMRELADKGACDVSPSNTSASSSGQASFQGKTFLSVLLEADKGSLRRNP